MPKRVNSFPKLLPAAFLVFVLGATIAVAVYSPARADSVCIEQPSQPAPEGTRWSTRDDRAKARKCWFLVDAYGRDVTALLTQPSAAPTPELMQTLSSQLAALFGNSTAAPANAAPQATAPQINPVNAPRKPQANAATATKVENGVRADQKSVGEGHVVKRAAPALSQAERNALFEEFLQWYESRQDQLNKSRQDQQSTGQQDQRSVSTLKPWPPSR